MDMYKKLIAGEIYEHTNGTSYQCIGNEDGIPYNSILRRLSDSWTLLAHGTRMDKDGFICWNYSTGGHWADKEQLREYLKIEYPVTYERK